MADKLKILLLGSNHTDLLHTSAGDEYRIIENTLDACPGGDQVEIIKQPAIRLSELGRMLMKYEPDIVHISGHGDQEAGIVLENDDGEGEGIGAVELAELLRKLNGKIRLLVLNLCHTRKHVEVISRHIDYVVGMDGAVQEVTASAFARYFYQALGYGKTVKEAFQLAKSELRVNGYAGAKMPFMRMRKGVIDALPLFSTSGTKPLPLYETGAAVALRDLSSKFVTQLRIAGNFQNQNHEQQTIYLDKDLYVHRLQEEEKILEWTERFVVSNSPIGKWVCIIGDAGHGKSSLLWYVFEQLKDHKDLQVIPFLAQLEPHGDQIESTVLQFQPQVSDARRCVVLIDTLDILVGINDPSLAAMLNALRARGCLVITTSRRQEAERLFKITPSDLQIPLRQYSDEEAQQAIANYVNLAFGWWDRKDQERQIQDVWGVLEQQRNVRELNLEPLILRMFFEAYAPDDIPRDINTQQIYKKYWTDRVHLDRTARDSTQRFTREQITCIAAREIGFGDSQAEKISVDRLQKAWFRVQAPPFPYPVLEGLVSTGIFQWAEGMSTIRFFHQTFFEYAAAHDLLSADEPVMTANLKLLLHEIIDFQFFRAPILKQFTIQAFESGNQRWRDIMRDLRNINNELSAKMVLEIVGKLPNNPFLVELCKEWMETSRDNLENVVCEIVQYYPRSKTPVALALLAPYLHTSRANAIYGLCINIFAIDAPAQVCEFLRQHLPNVKDASDDEKTMYRQALCATIQHGANEGFSVLLELFPYIKSGQQMGLLKSVSEIMASGNVDKCVNFLQNIVQLLPQVSHSKRAEVWAGMYQASSRLHELSPAAGKQFAGWLYTSGMWKQEQTAAQYTGMIIAPTVSDLQVIRESLAAIAEPDHFTRLMNTELLSCLDKTYSVDLMDYVLALKKENYQERAKISSLFRIVAGLTGIEPAKILQFLEQWPWQNTGVGTSLRTIFTYLAESAPAITKDWLLQQVPNQSAKISPQLFTAFQILIQQKVEVFEPTELRQLYTSGFAASKEVRQIFAGVTGSIAKVDTLLADEIFQRIFTTDGKESQEYTVSSLHSCVQDHPEFIIIRAGLLLQVALSTRRLGILHNYLILLKEFPAEHRHYLLPCLNNWFTAEILQNLRDEKTYGELLIVLKIIAKSDPRGIFDFSSRIPLSSKGVAGGFASIYDHISKHSQERGLLLELLERVMEISQFDQVRMLYSLGKILPRLDQKLGGRIVVRTILNTYKGISNQQALKTFIRAALLVPSWTEADTMKILADTDIPSSVRGLLATKI